MNAFRPAPWLLLPLFIAACGKKETPPPAPTPADSGNPSEQAADSAAAWQQARTLAWERSAHHAVLEEWPQARAAMAPVASDPRAEAADLVRAATIELQAGMPGQAEVLLDRAKAQGPELPAALWLRARLATNSLDQLPQARTLLEELNQQQPADLATRYALARIYEDLEPDSDAEWDANQKRAQDLYRSIFEQGLANGTVWYVSSLYRLYVLSLEDPDPAVTQQYEALWNGVQSIGAKAASVAQLNEGELARLLPPAAGGHRARAVGRMPAWKRLQRLEAPVGGAHNLVARDLDGDHLADLFWLDQEGLLVWRQVQEGTFEAQRVATGAIDGVLAGDLSRDGVLDFLVVRGGDLTLLDGSAGEDGALHYSEVPQQVTLPLAPKDLCWLDYDHDGDLDVLAVGDFGLRMLRNDGAGKIPERGPDQARGGFSDVTESLGVTAGGALTWCAAEDFDRDQDVDFLVGGPGRTLLASSLRSGRFADVTKETLGSDRPDGNRPNLADFDGDGVVDLLYRDATGFTLRFGGPGARKQQLLASPSTDAVCGDLDLDGQLDALWGELPRMGAGFLAVGADVRKPQLPASPGTTESLLLAELDRSFDGPLQLELLRLTATGVEIWHDPTRPAMACGCGSKAARTTPTASARWSKCARTVVTVGASCVARSNSSASARRTTPMWCA
ncbi:MAG: VCBS repeat-containing protein [Planctomycetota bacterium]